MSFRAGGIDMATPCFDWEPEGDHEKGYQVVRMVLDGHGGRGRGLVGAAGSLLMTVLANRTAPTFSGEESDWEAFSHDLKIFADIMRESEGGHVPEVFLFDLFLSSVDAATQNRLRAMRNAQDGAGSDVRQILTYG